LSLGYDWQCPVLVDILLFLVPVLDTLGLQQALQPVQNLVDEILNSAEHPAVLIAAAGWLLATGAPDCDKLAVVSWIGPVGNGLDCVEPGANPLRDYWRSVYVILIPVAIAALNALS